MQETQAGDALGWADPLKEGLATHSSILARRIPWTEKPGRLQSVGSQRFGYDWSDLACMHVPLVLLINWKSIKLNKSVILFFCKCNKLFIENCVYSLEKKKKKAIVSVYKMFLNSNCIFETETCYDQTLVCTYI